MVGISNSRVSLLEVILHLKELKFLSKTIDSKVLDKKSTNVPGIDFGGRKFSKTL